MSSWEQVVQAIPLFDAECSHIKSRTWKKMSMTVNQIPMNYDTI
jgi:hypothetical protein